MFEKSFLYFLSAAPFAYILSFVKLFQIGSYLFSVSSTYSILLFIFNCIILYNNKISGYSKNNWIFNKGLLYAICLFSLITIPISYNITNSIIYFMIIFNWTSFLYNSQYIFRSKLNIAIFRYLIELDFKIIITVQLFLFALLKFGYDPMYRFSGYSAVPVYSEGFAGVLGESIISGSFILLLLYSFWKFIDIEKNKSVNLKALDIAMIILSLLTFSKTIILSITFFSYILFSSNIKKKFATISLIIISFTTIVITVNADFLEKRFADFYYIIGKTEKVYYRNDIKRAGSGRVSMWDSVIKGYLENDMGTQIIGAGLGADRVYTTKFFISKNAHNDFLCILASSGVLGLIVFVLFFYKLHKSLKRVLLYEFKNYSAYRLFNALYFSAIIFSLFDGLLYSSIMMIFVYNIVLYFTYIWENLNY